MMQWAQIISTQTEHEWFEDYVRTVLACTPPSLPKQIQKFGSVTAKWEPYDPGVALITVEGGSVDDRWLAESLLREQLKCFGYRQARFSFDGDEQLRKTSTWMDVQNKAKRLIQSGNVTLLRNGYNNVVSKVVGDHGEYQVELAREDPNSRVITQWQCDCPWSQYAFQRTRQWKKYEARMCAHALATSWASMGSPTDDEIHPQTQQMQMFSPPTPQPYQQRPRYPNIPPEAAPQGQQLEMEMTGPGQFTGNPPLPGPGVQDQGVIPPFPGDQMPNVNPVSVPGAKPVDPSNPIQYPGGTFSHVSDWKFDDPDTIWHMSRDFNPQGPGFENSYMVQLKKPDIGITEGKGGGQWREIPQNSIGEVLAQDPTTGFVEVIFPLHDTGELEPYAIRAWFSENQLTPRPDIQRPGPFIKRR